MTRKRRAGQVRHEGGRLTMVISVKDLYDFLATVQRMPPGIDTREF